MSQYDNEHSTLKSRASNLKTPLAIEPPIPKWRRRSRPERGKRTNYSVPLFPMPAFSPFRRASGRTARAVARATIPTSESGLTQCFFPPPTASRFRSNQNCGQRQKCSHADDIRCSRQKNTGSRRRVCAEFPQRNWD